MPNPHGVLVVDFGAQYAQLIARRVREADIYSEIVPSSITAAQVSAKNPEAIILSGGPSSVYAENAPSVDPAIFALNIPIFGICYGFQAMAAALVNRGYQLISGGTDNHMMLIDLRNKNITGRDAENALGEAAITVNKNMVPFDDKSPFVTSGIRVGTAAVSTRGLKEKHMERIVELIDEVISKPASETNTKKVRKKVNEMMGKHPLYS